MTSARWRIATPDEAEIIHPISYVAVIRSCARNNAQFTRRRLGQTQGPAPKQAAFHLSLRLAVNDATSHRMAALAKASREEGLERRFVR